MKLKNLKEFNPEKVALIETHLWQAYYRHHFLKLFFLLLELIRNQFRLNYWYTFKTSYGLALAAVSFRLNRGKENKEIIVKKLTKVFKTFSKFTADKFDYRKAAELEFEWWMVDRYPEKYQINRREALRNAMASIYNVVPEKLVKYAEYRAQAMELQDEAEKIKKEANWEQVQIFLLISYQALYDSIRN